MSHLNFWLHMDDRYMWRWYCSDPSGTLVAISAQSFFRLADCQQAADEARAGSEPKKLAA